MKDKVVLKDIAQATGLSVNSVSRALKNKEGISAATRKTVQETAKAMGYIPNSLASAMRSGHTDSVAIILGEMINPYNARLIHHLTIQLHDRGYTTLMFVTNQKRSYEDKALPMAISKNVDAIISATQLKTENAKLILNRHIPFVQIGMVSTQPEFNQVSKDEYHAGYIAARHLLQKGHRKIIHIIFPEKYFAFSHERLRGVRQAYAEFNVPYDEDMVYTYHQGNAIASILERAREKTPDFTAVIAGNDMLAWQVIEALKEKGVQVPRDCGVVGFDDLQSFIHVPYVLTSVGSHLSDLTGHAVDLLIAQLENKTAPPRVYVENTYLIEGETT